MRIHHNFLGWLDIQKLHIKNQKELKKHSLTMWQSFHMHPFKYCNQNVNNYFCRHDE
jgi:hypothetical protein